MAIRSVVTAVVPVVVLFVVLCARKPGMLCIVQCKFCTAHIEQNLFPLRSVWQRDWKPCTELLPLCSGEMLRNCPSALLGRAASELVVETFWARWWWLPACCSVLTPNVLIYEGCRFFLAGKKHWKLLLPKQHRHFCNVVNQAAAANRGRSLVKILRVHCNGMKVAENSWEASHKTKHTEGNTALGCNRKEDVVICDKSCWQKLEGWGEHLIGATADNVDLK